MFHKGNYLDNSVMETFSAIMKQEMYNGIIYYSFDELKTAIEKCVYYYNRQRIKEKPGCMSPVEYRLSFLVT